MNYFKNLLFCISSLALLIFVACSEDEPEAPNLLPTVSNPVNDQTYQAGFGTATINLSTVFDDEETSNLTIEATSSNEGVVTVSVSGQTLTITEVSTGNSLIVLTATDDENASVSDQFTVLVSEAANNLPEVVNPISDVALTEGFGTEEITLASVFSDVETMMLQFSATSSEAGVVTVSLDRADLTITEVGLGTSTITVTATDEDGGTATDEFTVTVSEAGSQVCTNNNSIDQNNFECDETPSVANSYSESVAAGTRTIVTNGIPTHDFRNQIPMLVSELNSSTKTFEVDATPTLAASTTDITNAGSPVWKFGIALNGVPIDPAPAQPFIFEDQNTGEFNFDWVFEPTWNMQAVGLDCAVAHVQPDGVYHYHGDMGIYADQLLSGLGAGTTTPTEPVQIGWSADGFPILYKYGPNANGNIQLLESSYRVKSGERPGDGVTEPCGTYNGKYTNDFEYAAGTGDLDECNGVERSITIGGETFAYFYVITDDFPVISRCMVRTPDKSFKLGPSN